MDREKLRQRLMATFLFELDQHCQQLDRRLLALEAGDPTASEAELLAEILRSLHSLKGAAGSVDQLLIRDACHSMESAYIALRDRGHAFLHAVPRTCFEFIDALREASAQLTAGKPLHGLEINKMGPRLARLHTEPQVAAPAADSLRQPARPAAGVPAPATTPQHVPEVEQIASDSAREPTARPAIASAPPIEREHFLRVASSKLDHLLSQSGELLVAVRSMDGRIEEMRALRQRVRRAALEWRAQSRLWKKLVSTGGAGGTPLPVETVSTLKVIPEVLVALERGVEEMCAGLERDAYAIDGAVRTVESSARRARMLPFSEACERLERPVRDIAVAEGKQARLVLSGGDVELDRAILDALKDPLLHLVRNAVDHGLETPDVRRAAGKDPTGSLSIAVSLRGESVLIKVSDDGRGLDFESLKAEATRRGLPADATGEQLSELIFQPGYSTARTVTDISGRGIGLDVVRSEILALQGDVLVESTPGRGTTFEITVPLTLTTAAVIFVKVGGRMVALIRSTLHRLISVTQSQIGSVGGRPAVMLPEGPIVLSSLAQVLEWPAGPEPAADRPIQAVVISSNRRSVAFHVDEVLGEQDVVVRHLGPRLKRVKHVSGGTLLSTGAICLILNSSSLVKAGLIHSGHRVAGVATAAAAPLRRRLLVVDDTVTTRTLEKEILESAGYHVLVASDGQEAWQLLHTRGADLIVSDVDMPRVDGFALTEMVRSSKQFASLPVVLVTSRESDADRARGVEVGANAYIVKSTFDQRELVDAVARLI
jgi:two-component system chemotaxis sensor kinase CheA